MYGTSVDGPGLRTSVYGAGCEHHCAGCHNQQTWDPSGGQSYAIDRLANEIVAEEMDVTFSGGDPMFQALAFAKLAKAIKERSTANIWCYTGYTIEQVIKSPLYRWLLDQVDVLVDGPFVEAKKDSTLLFRGSANQRIIDVKATYKKGEVVLWHQHYCDYADSFGRQAVSSEV